MKRVCIPTFVNATHFGSRHGLPGNRTDWIYFFGGRVRLDDGRTEIAPPGNLGPCEAAVVAANVLFALALYEAQAVFGEETGRFVVDDEAAPSIETARALLVAAHKRNQAYFEAQAAAGDGGD